MIDVVTIAGCPSPISRSTAILHYVNQKLAAAQLQAKTILLRQIPAQTLLAGRYHNPVIQENYELVKQASGIILGTPIHKGAYSEGMQAFLDLLPRQSLAGKVVLPVVIGQQEADFFAVDHALRTFLGELGVGQLLEGVYVQERHVHLHNRQVYLDDPAKGHLERGIHQLLRELSTQKLGQQSTFTPYAFHSAGRLPLTTPTAFLNVG